MVLFLFVSFYIFYFTVSFSLAKTMAFSRFNLLFESDVPRVIQDITCFSADHYRTSLHPAYVLMVNPIGSFLSKHLVHSDIITAVIINSFFGAFAVALAFIFFWLFSKACINSLLLSLLFGLSISQIFFGIVPETHSLATCSLLALYILFLVALQKKRLYFVFWVLIGVFVLCVTTTNFIQVLILFTIAIMHISPNKKIDIVKIRRILSLGGLVLLITIFLSLLQRRIYPSCTLFFTPEAYIEDYFLFFNHLLLKQPFVAVVQIIKGFFLTNFIAPQPDFFFLSYLDIPSVTFASSHSYTFAGWAGIILWSFLLITGIVKIIFSKCRSPFFIAAFLCLLLNIFLHSFYNAERVSDTMELLIYSGNFTFLVLSFLSNYLFSKKIFVRVLLILLILVMGVNNLLVLNEVMFIYR